MDAKFRTGLEEWTEKNWRTVQASDGKDIGRRAEEGVVSEIRQKVLRTASAVDGAPFNARTSRSALIHPPQLPCPVRYRSQT